MFHSRVLATSKRRNHQRVALSCRAPNRQCIWSSFSWLLSSASSQQLSSSVNIRYPVLTFKRKKRRNETKLTKTQYLQRSQIYPMKELNLMHLSAYRLVDNVIKGLVSLVCTTIQSNDYIFCFNLPRWDEHYCEQIWTNPECFHKLIWLASFEVGGYEDILEILFFVANEFNQSIPYENLELQMRGIR